MSDDALRTHDWEPDERWMAACGPESCDSISPDGSYWCCREFGHAGAHQSAICDGTCDTCDCEEWTDDDAASAPTREG